MFNRYKNQCWLGNWSKSEKDIGVKIDSKSETESQNWGPVSHSQSSSIFLNENLPICEWFVIGQVQDGVMKLNLG